MMATSFSRISRSEPKGGSPILRTMLSSVLKSRFPIAMNHHLRTHIRSITMNHTMTFCFIFAACTHACADGIGEIGPSAVTANEKREDAKYVFSNNYPRYRLISPQAHQILDNLAKTKPIYDAGTGVASGGALWAEVSVYGQVPKGADGSWFTIGFFNVFQPGDDGSISYRMGVATLSRMDCRGNKTVRRVIGSYDVQTSLDLVLADFCKDARIAKPKALSPTEQRAPSTIALYSCEDESVFADVGRLMKESRLSQDVPEGKALAEIRIAPLAHLVHRKEVYMVEMFSEPGKMRVSSKVTNDAVMSTVQVVGYIDNTTLWQALCDRCRK